LLVVITKLNKQKSRGA